MDYDTLWVNQRNNSRQLSDNSHQQDRGHSKVYLNHHHTDEFDSLHPKTSFDSRRYDFEKPLYKQQDSYHKCTRRTIFPIRNIDISTCGCQKNIHMCTRNQKANDQLSTIYCPPYFESTTHSNFNSECSCTFSTRCQNTNVCVHRKNCDCNAKCPSYNCPNMLKSLKSYDDASEETQINFHEYDLPLKDTTKKTRLNSPYDQLRRLKKRKDEIYDYRQVITSL